MTEELIAPGKKLLKPLVHPVTHNVLLPAGTVLTSAYIERIARQGLESYLLDCLDIPAQAGAGSSTTRDLDDFEIDIPPLPDILAEFMAPPKPAFVPQAAAPANDYTPTAMPPGWVPSGDSTAPEAIGRPDPPYAAAPAPAAMAAAMPIDAPTGLVAAARYYHNPGHFMPERSLMGAMLAVDSLEANIKAGSIPQYADLCRVVQEVIDRLSSNIQGLNSGIEIRVVNQPHHRSHPVNVFILSVTIGLAMSYDPSQLLNLGLGALCHDIGKTAIPPELLDKVGPLQPQEVDLLRAHTLMGKRIMEKLPWSTPLLATIVYEHHERNDGSGYPQRLTDRQINEMSKIVAVAEVYDALMSDTSYRARYTPELAYNSIRVGDRSGLDAKVIRAFQRYIVPYPLHSYVLLDTQEVGQVVQVNRQQIFKPVVKIGGNIVDLADQSSRTVVNSHFKAF